ncbi:MAG: hypothetical protein WCE52_10275 [Candidatus Acidiferrum sp.]
MPTKQDFTSQVPNILNAPSSPPIAIVLPWHKAYGEALLYAACGKAGTFIAKAEQEICLRYLELSVSSIQPEETRDLQNAVAVLAQLKRDPLGPAASPLTIN